MHQFKNGSQVKISPDAKVYQGLDLGHIIIEELETKRTLWHRIKMWFLIRKLRRNGEWVIWTSSERK